VEKGARFGVRYVIMGECGPSACANGPIFKGEFQLEEDEPLTCSNSINDTSQRILALLLFLPAILGMLSSRFTVYLPRTQNLVVGDREQVVQLIIPTEGLKQTTTRSDTPRLADTTSEMIEPSPTSVPKIVPETQLFPLAEDTQPTEPEIVDEVSIQRERIQQLKISNTGDPYTSVVFAGEYRELTYKDQLVEPTQIILHWDGQPGTSYGWTTRKTFNGLSEIRERSELLEDGTINVEVRSTNAHFGVDKEGVVQFLPMYEGYVQHSYGAFGYYDAINIEMAGNNFTSEDGVSNVPQEEIEHTLNLVINLMIQYEITFDKVVGHYERDTYTDQYGMVHERGKLDPGREFMGYFRTLLAEWLNGEGIDMGQPLADTPYQVIGIPLHANSPYEGYAKSEASTEWGRLFTDRTQEYLPVAPEDLPPQSVTQTRNRENLLRTIGWFNIEESQRYQPLIRKDEKGYEYVAMTYCNILAWDISTALQVPLPRYAPQLDPTTEKVEVSKTTANWLYLWLTREGEENFGWQAGNGEDAGWREVTAEEAQELANRGQPVVAVAYHSTGHGHIAFVMPGQGILIDDVFYPILANVGRETRVGLSAYEGFQLHLMARDLENEMPIRYFTNSGRYEFIETAGTSSLHAGTFIDMEQRYTQTKIHVKGQVEGVGLAEIGS
jgi:hypothetical protein